MSLFSSWLASSPPDAAIEIAPERVSVAVVGERGGSLVVQAHASETLPPGAVVGSLTSSNVHNRTVVAGALRSVLERAGVRPRRAALVIPDLAAKVSLVRFDTLPARREDLDQLVRWQVKKASPFPIEEALVSWTPAVRNTDGSAEFVVVSARRDIVAEYEAVCDQAKVYAGLVDLATLSIVNLVLGGSEVPAVDWLVVHLRPNYTSIVIMRGEHVIFFRNRAKATIRRLPISCIRRRCTTRIDFRVNGSRVSCWAAAGAWVVPSIQPAETSRSVSASPSSRSTRRARQR
jgi:Tfp pilus assembly PilM family ATPase